MMNLVWFWGWCTEWTKSCTSSLSFHQQFIKIFLISELSAAANTGPLNRLWVQTQIVPGRLYFFQMVRKAQCKDSSRTYASCTLSSLSEFISICLSLRSSICNSHSLDALCLASLGLLVSKNQLLQLCGWLWWYSYGPFSMYNPL